MCGGGGEVIVGIEWSKREEEGVGMEGWEVDVVKLEGEGRVEIGSEVRVGWGGSGSERGCRSGRVEGRVG